jgi:GT2 family glycosyltransferase
MNERIKNLDIYTTDNLTRANDVKHAYPRHSYAYTKRKLGLSVVILNLNKPELITPLVGYLLKQQTAFRQQGLTLEVLVGDTGSTDLATLACLEQLNQTLDGAVTFKLKYNFSACNNQVAFAQSSCELLLFLNNDIIFANDTSLLELYAAAQNNPSVGVLGALLFFENGLVQHAGVDFFRQADLRGLCYHPLSHAKMTAEAFPNIIKAPATTGAFLAISSTLFEAVGGFDESYVAECQDVALCLAVHRYGYSVVTLNLGQTIHLENATRPKNEEHWPDRQRFLRKWGSYIQAHFLS